MILHEAIQEMTERDWVAMEQFGIWFVGPEASPGIVAAVGHGAGIPEAVQNALEVA